MAKTIEEPILTFTQKAIEKVKEFMKEENNTNLYLRVYIASGGCAGFSYGMAFEESSYQMMMLYLK